VPEHGLGERVRSLRQHAGISVRGLARQAGVSPSLVSQIELNKVMPSITTLTTLARVLGTTAGHLLGASGSTASSFPKAAAAVVCQAATGDAPVVQRAGTRPLNDLEAGIQWERLTPFSLLGMEFMHTVYEPGSESSPDGMYRRHSGFEWVYVLSGKLHVSVGFDDYVLAAGDSISFSSNVHHRSFNEGPEPAHAIWSVLAGEGDTVSQSPLFGGVSRPSRDGSASRPPNGTVPFPSSRS
jgi:transcriptional regulator with XRE-family HTH domain